MFVLTRRSSGIVSALFHATGNRNFVICLNFDNKEGDYQMSVFKPNDAQVVRDRGFSNLKCFLFDVLFSGCFISGD